MNNVVLELSRGAYPFLKIHNLEVAKPGLIALPSSAAQSCSAEAAPFWGTKSPKEGEDFATCPVKDEKADSTLRSSQAVPHPRTNRTLCCLTSEVRRDPVHSTRYGRQRHRGIRSVLSITK